MSYITNVILHFNGEVKKFSFENDEFSVGRSKICEIQVNDGHLSRVHFKVKRIGKKIYVVDQNSTNGTIVNGSKIKTGKVVEVGLGDIISFGDTDITLKFDLKSKEVKKSTPRVDARKEATKKGLKNPLKRQLSDKNDVDVDEVKELLRSEKSGVKQTTARNKSDLIDSDDNLEAGLDELDDFDIQVDLDDLDDLHDDFELDQESIEAVGDEDKTHNIKVDKIIAKKSVPSQYTEVGDTDKLRSELFEGMHSEFDTLKKSLSDIMNKELGKVLEFTKEQQKRDSKEAKEKSTDQTDMAMSSSPVNRSNSSFISRSRHIPADSAKIEAFNLNDSVSSEIRSRLSHADSKPFSYNYHANPILSLKYNNTGNVSTADKVNFSQKKILATQLKHLKQSLESNMPQINVDPQEILLKAEEELELSEVDKLHIEQKKLEAKVVSMRLIQQAEDEAKKILDEALYEESTRKEKLDKETKELREEISHLRSEYNNQKDEFDKKVKQINVELRNLTDTKIDCEKEIDQLYEKIELSKDSIAENNKKIQFTQDTLAQEKERLKKTIEDMEALYKSKEKELLENEKNLNYNLNSINDEIESKNKVIKLLEEQKTSINISIDDLVKREAKKQEEVDIIDKRIHQLYIDREALETDVTKVRTHAETLREEVSQLSEKVSSLNVQIDAKREELLEAKNNLQLNYEREKQALDNTLENFKKSHDAEKQQLTHDLEEYRKQMIDEVEKVTSSIMSNAYEQRDKANAEYHDLVGRKNRELEEKRREHDELQNEIDQRWSICHQEIDKLKSQVQAEIDGLQKSSKADAEYLIHNTKLEADEMIASAQRTSKEKISKANLEANKIVVEGKKQLEKLVDKANKKKNGIVEGAYKEKEAILSKAKEEALEIEQNSNSIFQESQERSERIVKEAQAKAAQIQETNLKDVLQKKAAVEQEIQRCQQRALDATERIKNLNFEFNEIKNNMKKEQDRIRQDLEAKIAKKKEEAEVIYKQKVTSAQKIYEEKIKKSEDICKNKISSAQQKHDELINSATEDYEKKREELEAKLDLLQKETLAKIESEKERLTKDFKDKMKAEKTNLAMLRAQETENLKRLRDEAETKISRLKEGCEKSIVNSIENIVLVELKNNIRHDLSPAEMRSITKSIQTAVKANFSDDAAHKPGLAKKLSPYGKIGEGKSKSFWIKVGVGAFVALSFLISYIVSPETYTGISSSIGESLKVEESAQKMFIDKVKEERENRPKFDPELSDDLKGTYTANVIYTRDFAKKWMTDDFQADWTVRADSLFVNELDLPDTKVIQFVSEEFKLVRDLQYIREKIRLETKDQRFKEMRDLEAERKKILLEIVGSEENLKKINKYQSTFWK